MLQEVIETGTASQALLLPTPGDALRHLEDLATLKPVLLLLDFALPHMSGIELYDRLHAQLQLAAVPALFLSAVKQDPSFPQAWLLAT